MKISEAMRLGAKTTDQAFGTTAEGTMFSRNKTCAMGAAFLAANCPSYPSQGYGNSLRSGKATHTVIVPTDWLQVLGLHQTCPECLQVSPLRVIIAHLNDEHRWTRERIADFVEQIEQAVKTEPELAAV